MRRCPVSDRYLSNSGMIGAESPATGASAVAKYSSDFSSAGDNAFLSSESVEDITGRPIEAFELSTVISASSALVSS